MDAFVKANAVVRVRRRWLVVAGPVLSFACLVATATIVGTGALGVFLVGLAALLGVQRAWRRWPAARRGRLDVDRDGVRLDGEPIGLRARSGRVRTVGARTLVVFDRYLSGVEVDVATVGEGVLLLSALGIPARHTKLVDDTARDEEAPVGPLIVARFRQLLPGVDAEDPNVFSFVHGSVRGVAPRITFAFALGVGAAFAAAVAVAARPGAAVWFAPLLFALVVGVGVVRSVVRVQLGADGLRVQRPLSRARFVPYASIERVLHDGADVAIGTSDGRWLSVSGDALLSDRVARFVARVEERRQEAAAREPVDATSFVRAGRELGDWMKAVTGAMEANASFRTQAVPTETLWRIVEDGAAPATARAGAALAMRPALDVDGRARLRVLADGSADPRLRVALATVASEDDEDVAGALARVADR